MAQVKMYSKKDKRFVNFPIACTPSDDECKKCQLKFNCDKAKNKEEKQLWHKKLKNMMRTILMD